MRRIWSALDGTGRVLVALLVSALVALTVYVVAEHAVGEASEEAPALSAASPASCSLYSSHVVEDYAADGSFEGAQVSYDLVRIDFEPQAVEPPEASQCIL